MSLHCPSLHALALAGATLLAGGAAQAGEIYGTLGLPGAGLGYAHPLNSNFTVRGDFSTLGTHRKERTEDGITYNGELKTNRAGLFVDWFPFAGVFRLTGGVTANDYKLALDASGASGSITIGDTTYNNLSASDGLNVLVKFPRTTPYLGLGWGHQAETGLRFSLDIGASIGKAKVSAVARGALAEQEGIQAEIDKELADLRDGVGKVKVLPQISFAIGYSF
jgi:hypothetical protein